MKKIISLFSLLLLLSAASSQANVFVRLAQRTNRAFGRVPDRVKNDTMRKFDKGANIALQGACLCAAVSTAGLVHSVYKAEKAQSQVDVALKGVVDAAGVAINAAGKAIENTGTANDPFDEMLKNFKETLLSPTQDMKDRNERRAKQSECWGWCNRQGYRDVADVVCFGERDVYGSTPAQAREAAIKRMEEETANAGSVVPVKIEVVSVNGRKPYSKEDDPFLNLVARRHENIKTFLAVSTTEPSDRSWASRHNADFAKEEDAFYQNLENERKKQSARREALIRARQILESQ